VGRPIRLLLAVPSLATITVPIVILARAIYSLG